MAADVKKTDDATEEGGLLDVAKHDNVVEHHELSEVEKLRVALDVLHEENEELRASFNKEKATLIVESEMKNSLNAMEERMGLMESEYSANLEHMNKKLVESQKLLAERDHEIKVMNDGVSRKNRSCGKSNDEVEKLKNLLNSTKTENLSLVEKVKDCKTIAEKADIICETQKMLIQAKEEIILNLRKELESVRLVKCKDKNVEPAAVIHLTSSQSDDIVKIEQSTQTNNEADLEVLKNGVGVCCEFIKVHALNGALFNSFLLWADIQRKSLAEDIWKEQAMKRFNKEEIHEAKTELWNTCGEEALGKIVNRQGLHKKSSEVNDICEGLKKLSEADNVPLFLCTSGMVASTPIFEHVSTDGGISILGNKLNVIEKSLKSLLEAAKEIDDDELGNLNSSLVVKRLKSIEDSLAHALSNRKPNDVSDSPLENISMVAPQESANVKDAPNAEGGQTESDLPESDDDGFSLFHRKSRKTKNSNNTWRSTLTSIRGTARNSDNQGDMAADIQLVAYGLAKHVSGIQLSKFLEEKGLNIVSCDLLTKYEGARSLSYKITIRAYDLEKAQDASRWPERVGIRLYKVFEPNEMKDPKGRNGNVRRNTVVPRNRETKGGIRSKNPMTANSAPLRNGNGQQNMQPNPNVTIPTSSGFWGSNIPDQSLRAFHSYDRSRNFTHGLNDNNFSTADVSQGGLMNQNSTRFHAPYTNPFVPNGGIFGENQSSPSEYIQNPNQSVWNTGVASQHLFPQQNMSLQNVPLDALQNSTTASNNKRRRVQFMDPQSSSHFPSIWRKD